MILFLIHAPLVKAEENFELAGFLYFERCFTQENVCIEFNDQFPNISFTLSKTTETRDLVIFEGISQRTQDSFNHQFTQKVVIQKIENKHMNDSFYTISVQVKDETGADSIKPFEMILRGKITLLNPMILVGISFDQPEWGSKVTPKFYLGQKFIQH